MKRGFPSETRLNYAETDRHGNVESVLLYDVVTYKDSDALARIIYWSGNSVKLRYMKSGFEKWVTVGKVHFVGRD